MAKTKFAGEDPADIFERLYKRLSLLMDSMGTPDSLISKGDFSIYGDYWGHPQIRLSIHDLNLLRPRTIARLQVLIREFPGWSIMLVVAIREHYRDWPEMGLIIRQHEIVDGLQRRFFPKEFQSVEYEGSRPGTDQD